MLDLIKLEKQLDDALDKETTESLLEWLNNKRKIFTDEPTAKSSVDCRVMQKIAGIRWESRYSTTLKEDERGRWMRIGRINGMTVAIILKAKERFLIKLPNNSGDESLENHIIATDLGQGMLDAEKYIAKYVSNFSA